MPFSDLFKKPSPKETEKTTDKKASNSPTDDFMSPEMQKKRYDAALEFLQAFQERMPLVGGKPHAGTVLAVAARLAGTSLFRSLNNQKDITPGVVVLSEEVNQAWPQLMNLFAYYCKQNGVDVRAKPMVTQFPEKDKPLMTVEQVFQEYQDQYHEIMKKHGLDYLDAARAGMVVCSIIFEYHKIKDIDPYVATGIVAMGIVEGAKTAPPPLKTESSSPPSAQNNQLIEVIKSIAANQTNGSGQRLVIGEGVQSMMEALGNGGKYILLHPEVENKLKQNNIDPYLVYEAAIRIEIEGRIPQVDFVGGNVDGVLQTWRGKPQEQLPVHVRQLLWLAANASGFGYEQRGNSWYLKR
jgi:hypothetical protein